MRTPAPRSYQLRSTLHTTIEPRLDSSSELEEEIESAAGRLQALEKQRDSLLRGRKRKAMLTSI